MKYRVLVLALAAVVSGCDFGKEVHREDREFEVTHINPPKRMYVDLRDVRTGARYKDVSVSKRCSGWESLRIGSKWVLPEITIQYEDGSKTKRVDIQPLKSKIC